MIGAAPLSGAPVSAARPGNGAPVAPTAASLNGGSATADALSSGLLAARASLLGTAATAPAASSGRLASPFNTLRAASVPAASLTAAAVRAASAQAAGLPSSGLSASMFAAAAMRADAAPSASLSGGPVWSRVSRRAPAGDWRAVDAPRFDPGVPPLPEEPPPAVPLPPDLPPPTPPTPPPPPVVEPPPAAPPEAVFVRMSPRAPGVLATAATPWRTTVTSNRFDRLKWAVFHSDFTSNDVWHEFPLVGGAAEIEATTWTRTGDVLVVKDINEAHEDISEPVTIVGAGSGTAPTTPTTPPDPPVAVDPATPPTAPTDKPTSLAWTFGRASTRMVGGNMQFENFYNLNGGPSPTVSRPFGPRSIPCWRNGAPFLWGDENYQRRDAILQHEVAALSRGSTPTRVRLHFRHTPYGYAIPEGHHVALPEDGYRGAPRMSLAGVPLPVSTDLVVTGGDRTFVEVETGASRNDVGQVPAHGEARLLHTHFRCLPDGGVPWQYERHALQAERWVGFGGWMVSTGVWSGGGGTPGWMDYERIYGRAGVRRIIEEEVEWKAGRLGHLDPRLLMVDIQNEDNGDPAAFRRHQREYLFPLYRRWFPRHTIRLQGGNYCDGPTLMDSEIVDWKADYDANTVASVHTYPGFGSWWWVDWLKEDVVQARMRDLAAWRDRVGCPQVQFGEFGFNIYGQGWNGDAAGKYEAPSGVFARAAIAEGIPVLFWNQYGSWNYIGDDAQEGWVWFNAALEAELRGL